MNEKIIDFLIKAKKATYAGNGKEDPPSQPNSHDLHYVEGNFKYTDSYFGSKKFVGEEVLWNNDLPFWSMNYVGRVLSEHFSGGFLKEALSAVSKEFPYRGPLTYISAPYRYQCNINGDFDWFYGYESIYYNDIHVYECAFHGGVIE